MVLVVPTCARSMDAHAYHVYGTAEGFDDVAVTITAETPVADLVSAVCAALKLPLPRSQLSCGQYEYYIRSYEVGTGTSLTQLDPAATSVAAGEVGVVEGVAVDVVATPCSVARSALVARGVVCDPDRDHQRTADADDEMSARTPPAPAASPHTDSNGEAFRHTVACAFWKAVQACDLELVRELLATRWVWGWDAEHALCRAAKKGMNDMVAVLLDCDVTPNACGSHMKLRPLMYAVSQGHVDTIDLLLTGSHTHAAAAGDDSGRVVNARDVAGQTALMWAARCGQAGACKALLHDRRVDIDAKSHDGMTALMWAAAAGDEPTVRTLLAGGADASTRDLRGLSPLHWAKTPAVAAAVLAHGTPCVGDARRVVGAAAAAATPWAACALLVQCGRAWVRGQLRCARAVLCI